jgi:hypothetical protein
VRGTRRTNGHGHRVYHYAARPLGRVLAVVAIFVGATVVAFSPKRWDSVLMTLPRGHGIHLHEVLGFAVIGLGTVLLWHAPRSVRRLR